MSEEKNPWDYHEWHALGREAQLAAQALAVGVTTLGKANYASKGLYTKAFFDLSIGLERLGKLIIVTDWVMKSSGSFPTDKNLRELGHDLLKIKESVEKISVSRGIVSDLAVAANDKIHSEIWSALSEFGKISRYYNLDSVSGGIGASASEPIARWWSHVVTPILAKHYSPKLKARDHSVAYLTGALLGPVSTVLYFDESGEKVKSIESASKLTGATSIAQKYGRLYVLQIVRWMANILSDLSHDGAYKMRIGFLLGLNEPFAIFYNDDAYFKSRKTWSVYRP